MTRPLALVLCTAFLLSAHAASAKPKVALTQIEGDASGDVRDAVVEALEGGKELSLISGKEVNRAVDRLGDLADLTEKDFKKLATELEADAIVAGKLDKVGSSKTLKFRLYVHKKMAKGFTMSFKDAKSEKFRALLHDKMIDKIGAAASADGDEEKLTKKKKTGVAEDEEDPLAAKNGKKAKKAKVEDEEEAKPKKAKVAEDEEEAKPKKAKVAEDEEEAKPKAKKAKVAEGEDEAKPAAPSDEEEAKPAKRASADDEEVAPRRSKKKVAASEDGDELEGGVVAKVEAPHAANRVAVRLDIGASVVQRTFKFNSKPIDNRPKGPALSPVPGAHLEGELYPLAFSNPSSPAAGLGIGGYYDKTLSLNIVAKNMTTSARVPTKQSSYSIGVRYRLAFGKTATSPTLTLGAGYGKRLFSPQSAGKDPALVTNILRDTPSTNYTVIDPGLMFRLPVTRMVAFSVGGRGMLVTNAGSIQNLNSYGRAKVYGAEAAASIDVILGNRFALRFAGEFVQIGFQFTGAGMLSNNLDGDPENQDVGGLADRSIGGSATLAVMY